METVIIFTGCHARQIHKIDNCTPFMVNQLKRMAERNNWPLTIRKPKGGKL